jgi:hypothetical protein
MMDNNSLPIDMPRELSSNELESVCGGLYGSLMFINIWEIPNFCPPTASYAPLCPQ